MDVCYRRAQQQDAEQIAILQNEWTRENIIYGYQSEDVRSIVMKINEFSYIAECEGEVIGFVTASVHEAKQIAVMRDGEQYLEIDDIYIDSEFRDRGIGSGLLETVLNEAHAKGIERSLVYSATKKLDGIIDFYSRHGFKTWYVQMFK